MPAKKPIPKPPTAEYLAEQVRGAEASFAWIQGDLAALDRLKEDPYHIDHERQLELFK